MNLFRSVPASFGLALVVAASAQAQEPPAQQTSRGSITGVVTMQSGGLPIDQVNVRVVGTSLGSSTNAQGRYTISNISPGIYSVEATRIGLAPARRDDIRVVAGTATTVNLTMTERALVLSAVVTTGVSDPVSGAKAPFSVAKITAEKMPVASTGDALAQLVGKVAGMTIRPAATPGGDLSIQLRSPTSFRGNTQPMIIVDGVIQLQDDPSLDSRGLPGSDLDINPEDIASIEVVRGAAAAALYGQRAASGVIVIKTHRGESTPQGTTRISWSGEAGFSRLGHLVPLAKSHRFLVDQNNQFIDIYGRPVVNRAFVNDPDQFIDNKWGVPTYDHIDQLFGTGTTLITNASISQSSLATNFNVALGASNEGGVLRIPSAGVERYNVRMNLDHRVGDKLSLAIGTYYNRQFQRTIADGATIFSRMFDISPDIDMLARDAVTGRFIPFPDGQNAARFNPLYGESARDEWNKRAGLQSSFEVNYRPTSILSFQGLFGYQRSDRNAQVQLLLPGELGSDGSLSPGEYDISADFDEAMNGQLRAATLNAFGDWTLRTSAAVLGTIINDNGWTVAADTLAQPQPDLDFGRRYAADQTIRDQRTRSYSATLAADYQARYIIDALYRKDGNSLLPPSGRWQDNMRLSAAWSLAEEPWWRFSERLPLFKLRASVGTAGNNPLFADQYETYLQNGGTERIFKENMGNKLIVPEKVTEHEFGIDMSYQNRFGAQLSFVRTYTKDAIRTDTVLSYTGFDTQVKNLGDLLGHTYEATLEAQWISRPTLRWSSTLVADRSRVKIAQYPRRCSTAANADMQLECKGYSVGELYGTAFARNARQLSPRHAVPDGSGNTRLDEFQINDDGLLVAVGPNGSWTDGRWGTNVVVDGITYQWGMPIIQGVYDATGLRTGNALVNLGQALPKAQFGLANDVIWGKWTFFLQMNGQVGGLIYNRTKEDLYDFELHKDVDQAGKPGFAKKPSVYYTNQAVAASGSSGLSPDIRVDWFAEEAGYVKVAEAQIRYRFDELPYLRYFGVKQGSLSLIGRNLYNFTGYSGFDPEVGEANVRIDEVGYPRYRNFTFRAQLSF
jgi:TonB-linked SusC/RagA family outer membrane protein